MPIRHHTLRPKLFHAATATEPAQLEHGSCREYGVEAAGVAANAVFVVGAACGFERFGERAALIGNWLFIGGCAINAAILGLVMCERAAAKRHKSLTDKGRDELIECAHYFVSTVIFMIGCVFFNPNLYTAKHDAEWAHAVGSWCFIVGSIGFLLASYFNALGIAADHVEGARAGGALKLCGQLAQLGLLLTMCGSACFVLGSFLARPGYSNDACKEPAPAQGAEHGDAVMALQVRLAVQSPPLWNLASGDPAAAWYGRAVTALVSGGAPPPCISVADQSTLSFLVGCVLFLAQAALSLGCVVLMHRDKLARQCDKG